MARGSTIQRIARGAGLAFAMLVALPAPAAAEQTRAVMSVTATVVPSCTVEHRGGGDHNVACSTGATVSTEMGARRDEHTQAAGKTSGAGGGELRYLTITY